MDHETLGLESTSIACNHEYRHDTIEPDYDTSGDIQYRYDSQGNAVLKCIHCGDEIKVLNYAE